MSEAGQAPGRSERYQRWLARRAGWVLLALGAIGAGGIAVASQLDLRTSFAELLPDDDPGVVALARMQKRIGDMSLLLVGIRSPDREANVRYAETLTKRIRSLPPDVCTLATYHARDVLEFFRRNRWLYAKATDLDEARDALKKEVARRKNPLFVDLDDDSSSLDDIRAKLASRSEFVSRFPDGVFASSDGQFLWIAALPPGGVFSDTAGEGLFEAVNGFIAEDPPARYHPEMRVGQFGPVPSAISNRRAIERDVIWVTSVCVVIVGLSIVLYFRRLWALPLIATPAIIGTILAFGAAELAFGYLNASTVFLGSIILGNGINYAIIFASRYDEERGKGHTPERALDITMAGVWRATLVAAAAASAAYASLMATSFRGFSQFGLMGAVGCLLSWAATFTFMPAALSWLDRGALSGAKRTPPRMTRLGGLLTRAPRRFLAISLVATVVCTVGATHFVHDPFEYDFSKLSTEGIQTKDDEAFDDNRADLFGRWPNPMIVLADDVSQVEEIRKAIRRQDVARPGMDLIEQIVTINDVLPGAPEEQRRKLAVLDQIRKLTTDPALDLLGEAERKELLNATPPGDLRVITADDLPALARRPFTEADGTVGRVVLAYPRRKGISTANGKTLLEIAAVTQRLQLPDGKVIETSGNAVIFGAMLRSVLREGPIATVLAFFCVFGIVMATMRPLGAAVATLGALLLGAVWMIGIAGLAGTRITFLNFIALPITLGIGIEYAVNVVSRLRDGHEIGEAVASIGGAVALCSWTTIVGYGSLLAAQSRALRGFGAMAILGEIACLAAAVFALPAFMAWRRNRAA